MSKDQPILKVERGKGEDDYIYYKNNKKISKKEFDTSVNKWINKFWISCYDKLNLPRKHVDQIMKSLYNYQNQDYQLLKLPGDKLEYVPADAKIAAIIKKLWENGIITEGWDQGSNKYKELGFIILKYKTTKNKSAKFILEELFGDMLDVYNKNKRIPFRKNLKKIILMPFDDEFLSIEFAPNFIPKIHKKLKIKSLKNPLPGLGQCITTLGYKPAWGF